MRDPISGARPSILLVTLDTTRADALGLETDKVDTPALDALARARKVFSQAYATAPMTLPAHTSILTGLYPTEHGIHENGRRFADSERLLASRLKPVGYKTAAFVSAFPLAAEFGLVLGFDHYDDDFAADIAERPANETTDRALEFLKQEELFDPCSSGFTTSTRTSPTSPQSPTGLCTQRIPISARSPSWIGSSGAWWQAFESRLRRNPLEDPGRRRPR